MHFDEAITAHAEWKTRLLRYIDHPNGSLVAAAIEDHHACKLGAWVHGPATKYKCLAEYDQLVTDHAVFHKQAALIVTKINNGENVTVHDLTHPDSPYVIASRNVVTAILSMKRKIGDVALDADAPVPPVAPAVHEKAPAFLKISAASPEITRIILESATRTAGEIATLIKTYENRPIAPALVEIIRESVLIASSRMFMQILDETAQQLKSSGKSS